LVSWSYGRLIETGARINILYGDIAAACVLMVAVVVVLVFGVSAERRSLEDVAAPLSAASD
jgi:hypothetical protein